MRDPQRISQILSGLGAIWQANPDWRFGQLVENVFRMEEDYDHGCIFNIEDDKTLGLLRNALRTYRNPE